MSRRASCREIFDMQIYLIDITFTTLNMSFASTSSKTHAQATVAKLFSNLMPNTSIEEKSHIPTSSTQLLSNQFNTTANQSTKKHKKKTNDKIKKATEQDKKFRRMIKYNIIKDHKTHSLEETKYLAKLRRKNITQINNLSTIDDDAINQELEDTKASLIAQIGAKQHKRLRKRAVVNSKKNAKFDDFNAKVEKGIISYPGLTPGLAPIDYNESDSE